MHPHGKQLTQKTHELTAAANKISEKSGYFTGNYPCGTHTNFRKNSMQIHVILQTKTLTIGSKNTYNRRQKLLQMQTKVYEVAGNTAITLTSSKFA